MARIDETLLATALGAELHPAQWHDGFRRLLAHPGIEPLGQPPGSRLTLSAICGQHATAFPRVSRDESWLAARSMAVLAHRLQPLLAAGAAVSVDLSVLARQVEAAAPSAGDLGLVTQGLERVLPAMLRRGGAAAQGLVLSVQADHPGLASVLRLRRCAALGHPEVAIRLPDALMRPLCGAASAAEEHAVLWRWLTTVAHRDPGVHLLFERSTRPPCTLSVGEPGGTALPISLFEVGEDTAWLVIRLHLGALLADVGTAPVHLRRLLRLLLRFADNLIEQLPWPGPLPAEDALVNRRLALHLVGLGDLVDDWQLDPADFATLRRIMRWYRLIRRILLHESHLLARERGPFPGLELRELGLRLRRSFGMSRARQLLRRVGLRHRHLLVLSPYDVFPARRPRLAPVSYLDLLPVLRFGDTIAMHGDGVASSLPDDICRQLLQRSWHIADNRP